MEKPSKKVISTMIIVGAIVIAFIGADKIKNRDLTKKETVATGKVESVTPSKNSSMSIKEYLETKINENNTEKTEQSEPETVTDYIFTEFINNYLDLKEKKLNTAQNVEILTKSFAKQTKDQFKLPNKYNILDLKTFPDYEKSKIKKYGQEFAQITEKYFKEKFLIEENDSMKYVEAYANIQISYGEDLSKIDVPRSISVEHLEFINNLNKIAIAVVKIAEIENDPIFSHLILNQYNEIRTSQPNILIYISDYFTNNGIIFNENETGQMWNNF